MPKAGASRRSSSGQAEIEEFQRGLGPFVVAAETTRMPMLFTDARTAEHPIVFANDSFLHLTGFTRETVLGVGFGELLNPEEPGSSVEVPDPFGEVPDNSEVCIQLQDGSVAWASLFTNPVHDDEGNIVQHFVSLVDRSKERREQKRLHLLLDELNHRTLNTLVTVLGIAGQTLSEAADAEAFDLFEARIQALAKTHSLLSAENWVDVRLRTLVEQIVLPFDRREARSPRFTVRGEDVSLPPKAALTLGMVLQELATNAVKHGALSNDAGQVDISWYRQIGPKGPLLNLRWEESGGPLVKPSGRKGFGSRLIETGLARELHGEVLLDYYPAGVVCRIQMPEAEVA